MEKSFTLCLMMASLCSFGQLNPYFQQFETIPCAFDNSVTINAYEGWLIYQTLDGNWDGPVDSSLCIGLESPPELGIDLNSADITRPIFIRNKLTEANKQLLAPDYLYSAYASVYQSNINDAEVVPGADCPNNLCSGIIVGIQIPDETGASTNMRWYEDIPAETVFDGSFETCLPTEYFDENYLREFIIKLTLAPSATYENQIRLNFASLTAYWTPTYVDEVVADPSYFMDSSYNVPIYEVGYTTGSGIADPNYLLLYTDQNSYPSAATPAYVEGRPLVNTPDPQTINLIVSDFETLHAQPFTYLRGALVEGGDSIRHEVNLVNHNGDICLPGPIEFIFEDNSKYVHAGGHLNFEGTSSCMMFRNGSSLEVGEGATLQYGQDGKGFLLLRSGAQIKLDKGSTLIFDGVLWLQGIPTAKHPDPQFYLDLKPGTSLIFGENANVYNGNSTVPDVKLNVYMNGGTLDDSQLNPAARLLINRIYPKPSSHFSENVRLLQNPSMGGATIGYTTAGSEQVRLEIHDLQGRLTWSKTFEATEGMNSFEVDLSGTAAGVYMATLSAGGDRASVKICKF